MKKSELKSLLRIITEEIVAMQLEQTSDVPPDIQEMIEDLKKRLLWHDWSWRESDDSREYGNGQRKEEYIDKLMYDISKAGYKDAALKAWDEGTRERFKAHPKILPMAYGKAHSLPDKKIAESKGLSGMKKASDSSEHTEKVADSKDLTGPAPKEKQEGKKLPVVKKPANPQKVGSLKEEILKMIREEIDEMAMGRPPLGVDSKEAEINTIEAIRGILSANKNATDIEIKKELKTRAASGEALFVSDEEFLNNTIKDERKEISQSVGTDDSGPEAGELDKIEKEKAAQRAQWIARLRRGKK